MPINPAFKARMRKFREAARALDRQLARKDEVLKLARELKNAEKRIERLEKKVRLLK